MMYRSFGVAVCALACLLPFAACEQRGHTETSNTPERVVVYASYADRNYLPTLFDAYTKASGVVVTVRHGDADNMVDDVIENTVSPPADLLITPTVSGVWRAAEEGALRPLRSPLIEQRIPAWLRDPDNYWAALSYHTAVIAFDPSVYGAAELSHYAGLAEPEFHGRLCLSSSTAAINRAVVASLIDTSGVRPAEIIVRGWIKNLALPVFDSEEELLAAIDAGECAVGIASSRAIVRGTASAYIPAIPAVEVEGMAVARHAHNPDGALALAEWLSAQTTQDEHAAQMSSYPANRQARLAAAVEQTGSRKDGHNDAARLARHEEEAIKLAERARYQP